MQRHRHHVSHIAVAATSSPYRLAICAAIAHLSSFRTAMCSGTWQRRPCARPGKENLNEKSGA